jgi:hypothetical protein
MKNQFSKGEQVEEACDDQVERRSFTRRTSDNLDLSDYVKKDEVEQLSSSKLTLREVIGAFVVTLSLAGAALTQYEKVTSLINEQTTNITKLENEINRIQAASHADARLAEVERRKLEENVAELQKRVAALNEKATNLEQLTGMLYQQRAKR